MKSRIRLCAVIVAAAGLLSSSCASFTARDDAAGEALAERVDAVLARRGLGSEALSVIDNIVRHDGPPPPFAPPIVRELLARPPAAADAAGFFERSVPAELRRLVETIVETPESPSDAGPPILIRELLEGYLVELETARQMLRSAVQGPGIDPGPVLRALEQNLPGMEQLGAVAQAADVAVIARANGLFLEATARFVRALRAAGGRLRFPGRPLRFDSPLGIVSIGTMADDRHGPEAAVIIDPGGNDHYERAPATGGSVSVIIDLAGDDLYTGSDPAVHGLSAIVDFSGNDRYEMKGTGLGAAIAGASILVDLAGDDTYEAGFFGQGAAAFGLGALIDLGGNDRYRVRAGGQGFGVTGGTGLLWDRAGSDAYIAGGIPDRFERGGGVSMAQGAASGLRTRYGGGIGLLRDDAGDDRYEAQMFAQGVAYFYGAGLLWDGGGDDRYRAVRYAQGNGVHEAIGILRDESGNDRYALSVGVGQGMGLDLSVGLLFDGAGDDRYEAGAYAQGAATANGIGILVDSGGADRWSMSADRRAWGEAQWLRGLPSIGMLLYDPARAIFEREGKPETAAPDAAALGGPAGGAPVAHEPPGKPRCPEPAAPPPGATLPLDQALRRLQPGFAESKSDPALFADVRRRLTMQLRTSMASLPPEDFNVAHAFGEALRCTLIAADAAEAASLWDEIERALGDDPAAPFAGAFLISLRARPAPAPQMARILRILDANPRCGVRAGALSLSGADAPADAARAQAALRSSCWRLQAQALTVLKRLRVSPEAATALPRFLQGSR